MKKNNASFILAAVFGVLTQTASAWNRPPIPVPGGPCPPTYHQEQVTRSGWGFNGSIGGGYGPFRGSAGFQSPQSTQTYQQCAPNESRGMGNYPMPMPMPRPSGYMVGPMGPMPQSTPMWIRRY